MPAAPPPERPHPLALRSALSSFSIIKSLLYPLPISVTLSLGCPCRLLVGGAGAVKGADPQLNSKDPENLGLLGSLYTATPASHVVTWVLAGAGGFSLGHFGLSTQVPLMSQPPSPLSQAPRGPVLEVIVLSYVTQMAPSLAFAGSAFGALVCPRLWSRI